MAPGTASPYAPRRVRRAATCGAWAALALYAVQGAPALVLLLGGGGDGSAEFAAAARPLYTDLAWVLGCAAFGACHAVAALLTGTRAPAWTLLAAVLVPPVVHSLVGTRWSGPGGAPHGLVDVVTAGLLPLALLVSLLAAVLCRFVMQYWDPAQGPRSTDA